MAKYRPLQVADSLPSQDIDTAENVELSSIPLQGTSQASQSF